MESKLNLNKELIHTHFCNNIDRINNIDDLKEIVKKIHYLKCTQEEVFLTIIKGETKRITDNFSSI